MICPNCGGDFADWAPKCPYCGAMNYQGAERQYMEQLEEIREDMEELPEESEVHYQRHVRGAVKKIAVLAAIILAAGLAAAAGFFLLEKKEAAEYEARSRRRTAWEAEEFPRLDQWYEAGEYDRILEHSYELAMEEHEFNIYNWSHYIFIGEYYEAYLDCLYLHQEKEAGEPFWTDMAPMALRSCIFLLYDTTEEKLEEQVEAMEQWGNGLTEEERALIQGTYQEQARQVLYEDLGMTAEQAQALYEESLTEDGWLDYGPVYEYGEELAEQLSRQ